MRDPITPEETAEELRLWADYYEAISRALELLRGGAATAATLPKIVTEHVKAGAALKRLKEIRGIED